VTVIVHLPAKPARALAGVLALGLLTLGLLATLAACSSSGSSPDASSTAVLGSAIQQQCTTVGDVLADGPDPDADPKGYAEAQILPLRQFKLSDTTLQKAVQTLAAAYQAYSTSTGAANTTAAVQVSKAEAAVNAICPGAAN
jgi:hypothetical protein